METTQIDHSEDIGAGDEVVISSTSETGIVVDIENDIAIVNVAGEWREGIALDGLRLA